MSLGEFGSSAATGIRKPDSREYLYGYDALKRVLYVLVPNTYSYSLWGADYCSYLSQTPQGMVSMVDTDNDMHCNHQEWKEYKETCFSDTDKILGSFRSYTRRGGDFSRRFLKPDAKGVREATGARNVVRGCGVDGFSRAFETFRHREVREAVFAGAQAAGTAAFAWSFPSPSHSGAVGTSNLLLPGYHRHIVPYSLAA